MHTACTTQHTISTVFILIECYFYIAFSALQIYYLESLLQSTEIRAQPKETKGTFVFLFEDIGEYASLSVCAFDYVASVNVYGKKEVFKHIQVIWKWSGEKKNKSK